jgi:hypothetical protein
MHQVSEAADCIYCGRSFDPAQGEGDHIIPAALGEFRHDVHFRGCCPACNNKIGKCEQQLLRCGPESLLRKMVVPSSSRSRGKSSAWVGAGGAPPPRSVAFLDEAAVLVRHLDDPRNVEAPDQIILTDDAGEEYRVLLFPDLAPATLKERIKELKLKEIKNAMLHCNERNLELYKKMISQVYPTSKMTDLPSLEAGVHRTPAEIRFRINRHYFRAYAKIAFHYYLAHSLRSKGNEDGFAAIREFIINGKGKDKDNFFSRRVTFQDIDRDFLPAWWVHVLAAKEEEGVAVGYVCLFRGPESPGISHQIVLGRVPYSNIIVPKTAWTNSYNYDHPVPAKGKVGIVRSGQVIKKRIH